jgi:hypothetical protein
MRLQILVATPPLLHRNRIPISTKQKGETIMNRKYDLHTPYFIIPNITKKKAFERAQGGLGVALAKRGYSLKIEEKRNGEVYFRVFNSKGKQTTYCYATPVNKTNKK